MRRGICITIWSVRFAPPTAGTLTAGRLWDGPRGPMVGEIRRLPVTGRRKLRPMLETREGLMKRMMLAALVTAILPACASNKAADQPGARIRDTTMTAKDTTNPNDTLPHVRDTVPDSTRH